MEFSFKEFEKYILPLGLLASGFIIGFVVEKIFLYRVRLLAIKARWEGGRVILNSLKGITFLWFIIAGIYGALHNTDFIGPRLFSHLKTALTIILILSITVFFSKIATGFVKLYTGKALRTTTIFVNVTKVFVFIIGILVILQTIGISVTPILTALGVGGLAVALALQDTLSNLFAGLQIIASKKIQTGDFVRLESGQEGFLEDITWRNTSIRTPQNNTVVVPNSKIASGILVNYNMPSQEIILVLPLSVAYGSNLEEVERITISEASQVLKQFIEAIPAFDPIIRYNALADSSINFDLIVKVRSVPDQGLIKHHLIKNIYKRYQQEGIEIPYPARTVYVHSSDK